MEFVRENIHMNARLAEGMSQLTIEDDMNLSDARPDMEKIILEEGCVEITEVKAGKDNALIRGSLHVRILYVTDDRECVIDRMEGAIPFEEEIVLKGAQAGDTICVESEVTDLSVGLINSRKISIRSLVSFVAKVQTIKDMEIICGIDNDEEIACLRKEQSFSQLTVCKKDILRHKQELDLPAGYPDILQILWQDIRMTRLEMRAENERIFVDGELQLLVLYEGESEGQPTQFFEKRISFHEALEERDAKENMVADICVTKQCLQVDVKPDFDGRERVLQLDMALHLDISLYEQKKVQMVCDAYCVSQEVTCEKTEEQFPTVMQSNQAITTVEGELKIRGSHKKLMQVLGCMADVRIQDVSILENRIELTGFVQCKCLYVTNDDMIPYDVVNGKVPFTYSVEAVEVQPDDDIHVQVLGAGAQTSVQGEDSILVKTIVTFGMCIIRKEKQSVVSNIICEPTKVGLSNDLPQFCIYRVLENDTLWEIGKKFYVTTSQIMEMNGLTSDIVSEGQNLLIVR